MVAGVLGIREEAVMTHGTSLGRDWRSHAACRGEDPELFYPFTGGQVGEDLIERAKSVCRRCPVTEECLADALQARDRWGVWGGRDSTEREKMLRASAVGRG